MVWAVDVREASVCVAAAELRPDGPRVIAMGQAPAKGVQFGQITYIGDLTEALVEALRRAETAAGARCRGFYYNFDDPEMESRFPQGSRTLTGEGQVQEEDVRLAAEMAQRLTNHFERTPVYSREISFLIDGKDPMADPLGVFGRQLDVELHILLARARQLADWKRAVERARLGEGIPVVSMLSSVHGALSASQRQGHRIVWDLGADVLNGCVFERGTMREYAGRSAEASADALASWVHDVSAELATRHSGVEEIVVTGDRAEELLPAVTERSQMPVVLAAPAGLAPLESPRDAALAGLVRLASQMPRGRSSASQQEWVSGLKQKAEALMKEYF
jgi:cell division protein FtsA